MDIRRRAVAHTAAATRSGWHWQALLGDLTQAGIRFKNTSLGNFFPRLMENGGGSRDAIARQGM
jgi:hypothetical protein